MSGLMRLTNNMCISVQSRQPSLCHRHPYPLPEEHETQQSDIVRTQDSHKYTSDNLDVPNRQDPIEKLESHTERDGLLTDVHGDEHFRCVCVVRVNGVGEAEGKVEVGTPIAHGDAGKVAEPVEVAFGGVGVDEEAGGGDKHGGEHHTETHLGFADAAVFTGETRGESIGRGGKGNGEEVAYSVADGYEAGARVGPVVGWRGDKDGEGVVEGEGAEADVDTLVRKSEGGDSKSP